MKKFILYKAFFSTNPSHLILHVTNKCNLRCKTCFVGFEENQPQELSLDEIKNLAKDLGKIVWLDIGGGEPFLRNDLPEICNSFDTESVSIPTNGFNPDQIVKTTRQIRNTVSPDLSISVSLDGFKETHDYIRQDGSYEKAVETINKLKMISGVRLKVNTVLCEFNYEELIEFMDFVKKQFTLDFHSIILLRGNPRDQSFKLPEIEKLEAIKNDIFGIWKTYNFGHHTSEAKILQKYQRLLFDSSLEVIKRKKQIPRCLAGKQHLVVSAFGDVSFCEMLHPFANIREANLRTILYSEKAEQLRRLIQRGECFCHHNCNMLDNFFLNPNLYPKLLKGIFE